MAAFSHWHKWLPGTNPSTSRKLEKLVSTLNTANISRVGFLRHGQTGKSETGVDFDRLLTDHGRQQALQAGHSFGKLLTPFYGSLLVSPAPRTMETAQLFLDSSSVVDVGDTENNKNNNVVKLVPTPGLYDGTMQPKGSALFRKIGYAPLKDYLENSEDEQDQRDARQVLGAYAHVVSDSIMDVVTTNGSSGVDCTLWIVGHAIYLPAAALGVASLARCDDLDVVLNANTREAEGYLIDLDTKTVQYLSRGDEGPANC